MEDVSNDVDTNPCATSLLSQLEKVSVGEEERAERQEEWKDTLKRLRWAWETCGMGKMHFLHKY